MDALWPLADYRRNRGPERPAGEGLRSHGPEAVPPKGEKEGPHLADLDDASRHELRKEAKKLRYAAGFFKLLFDGKMERPRQKAFIVSLKKVQDRLGKLNDMATAPELLERLGLADDPDSTGLLGSGKKKALLASAEDAHGDLIDARRYWQ
nr:CHAD domain-containing protein [Paracoccus beibuensis]